MRCLFVDDLHYSLPHFDLLLQSAPRYYLVVLAGDALDVFLAGVVPHADTLAAADHDGADFLMDVRKFVKK